MPRLSPLRLCTAAGVAAGTAAAGLALAPAALAATDLAAPTAPTTVVAGEQFEVEGAGCVSTNPGYLAGVVLWTDLVDPESPKETDLVVAVPDEDGTWSATLWFPAGTAGEHHVYAVCDAVYNELPVEYPAVPVTVATGTHTPGDDQAVVPTGQVRGTSANTHGVASPDGGAATGDRTAVGQKVVKILTGFQPHEVVTVTLHSTPQRLGTFTADASGTVRVEFTLPAGTPAGEHTLVYEGDQGTYFQETLTVTAAGAAGDGDGDEGGLAYTGASIALPLGLGAGALALGGGLVLVTRRRSAAAAEAAQA